MMKRLITFTLALLTLIVFATPAHFAHAATLFVHNGLQRTYRVHLPANYDENTPTPLVVMLHGKGGSAASMQRLTEMNDVADEHGFIALYPEGFGGEWNYTRGLPWVRQIDIDDTDFIASLIDHLASEKYNIDPTRIYAAGLSNGGFMAQRLGCEDPLRYAAVGSVAATGFQGLEAICDEQPPTPILLMHGTLDPVVRWEGHFAEMTDGTVIAISQPAPQTLGFWASHNQCTPDFEQIDLTADPETAPTSVRLFRDTGCENGGAVHFYRISGGGHTWPGVDWDAEETLGKVNMDIHASEALWAFFEQFARPETSPA